MFNGNVNFQTFDLSSKETKFLKKFSLKMKSLPKFLFSLETKIICFKSRVAKIFRKIWRLKKGFKIRSLRRLLRYFCVNGLKFAMLLLTGAKNFKRNLKFFTQHEANIFTALIWIQRTIEASANAYLGKKITPAVLFNKTCNFLAIDTLDNFRNFNKSRQRQDKVSYLSVFVSLPINCEPYTF